MDPRIGFEIENLKTLISTLESRDKIAQLELAMGEQLPELPDGNQPVALIVRNLEPLSDADIDKLKVFFAARVRSELRRAVAWQFQYYGRSPQNRS